MIAIIILYKGSMTNEEAENKFILPLVYRQRLGRIMKDYYMHGLIARTED